MTILKCWNPSIPHPVSRTRCEGLISVQSTLVKPCIKELLGMSDDIQFPLLVAVLVRKKYKILH